MSKQITLEEIEKNLNVQIIGDKKTTISGVQSLDKASSSDVTFFHNEKYKSLLEKSKAGAICIAPSFTPVEGKNFIVSEDPSKTFAQITELLIEDLSPSGFTGIHPTAVIHQSAKIGKDVQIGPYVVIDKECIIGDRSTINAHCSIGPHSTLGQECLIHSNVVIRENCHLGNRVILQPSCVIGSCGYGYDSCRKTGVHSKIKHVGSVVLEDDVEVGSSTTIDRGRFDKTIIRHGTKIDNQCMIAHNCDIGPNNLIVSMSGVSGSVKTGRNVTIAAQCGLVGHIEIADGVTLAARSAPAKSIKEPGGIYLGAPAQNIKKEMVELAALRKLPSMLRKFKEAERLLEQFKNSDS